MELTINEKRLYKLIDEITDTSPIIDIGTGAWKELLKNQKIVEVVKKYKDTIIGCMKQSDANFVYEDADKAIEELEKVC